MGIYSLACMMNAMNKSYTTNLNSFVVLIVVGCIWVACGFVLYTMEEWRKKDIWKYVLLGVGTLAIALFMASLTAIFAIEFFNALVFGGFMAVATCYMVSRNIESTKVRGDVQNNLLKGLGFGLAACLAASGILLYMFGSKDIYWGMFIAGLIFALSGFYINYVLLYIIIPSLDEDDADSEDIIYGVTRFYVEKLLFGYRIGKLLVEKCKGGSK